MNTRTHVSIVLDLIVLPIYSHIYIYIYMYIMYIRIDAYSSQSCPTSLHSADIGIMYVHIYLYVCAHIRA